MWEGPPCPRPWPGTGGSRPAWPTAPAAHTHAPGRGGEERRGERRALKRRGQEEGFTTNYQPGGLALGDGSFRTMVSRDRAAGRLTGESGMKEDQYPYRVRFSTPLTRARRQFSAAWRTRPWLTLQGEQRGHQHTHVLGLFIRLAMLSLQSETCVP